MRTLILTTLSIIIFSLPFNLKSQSDSSKSIEIHGFIKSDYWLDSRQVVHSREGLFLFYPTNISLDKNGFDKNSGLNFNFTAITSRVNMKVDNKKAFGAKVSAFIEADFSGASNSSINELRLRHAYLKLNWKNDELLLGQYWHPMFVTDVVPDVVSLNTGAPFQPFSRTPLAQYTRNYKNTKLILSAISHRDFSTNGPVGRSYTYLSNTAVPNMHLQVKTELGKSLFGGAVDYKMIRPIVVGDSNISNQNTLKSLSIMAYYKFSHNKFTWKTKAIFGQNLTDLLMLGGYAYKSYDSSNGNYDYTNTNHLFAWTNFNLKLNKLFKKTFHNYVLINMMIGYAKNLGTDESNIGVYYSQGSDIGSLWRVSPSLTFVSGPIRLAIEYELTSVEYGIPDELGKISDGKLVNGHRVLFTGFYFF